MKILLISAALLFTAAVTSACDKNSIMAPCFNETLGGGSGGTCGSNR